VSNYAAADALMGIFGLKRVKTRKCVVCRAEFQPRSMTHKACKPECAALVAIKDREKKERRAYRDKKESLKRRGDHVADAQKAVNAYVRKRDEGMPCISCGKPWQLGFQAGHYRSVGSAAHLRFDADRNLMGQCVKCNMHLHGNLINYRIGLIARIGIEAVEALETDQVSRKYTIDDIKAIKAHYRAKLKELQK